MIMWLPVITDILVPTGSSWLLWFIAKWAFQQVVSILKSRCLTTTKSPHTEDCSDSQWKCFWTSIKHPSFKNNLFKDKFLEGISARRGRLCKESTQGAASGMSRCHFFWWLLMSLLSFYHVQLGWNFNMLESDLAGVHWPEELTIYGHGPALWPLKFWP